MAGNNRGSGNQRIAAAGRPPKARPRACGLGQKPNASSGEAEYGSEFCRPCQCEEKRREKDSAATMWWPGDRRQTADIERGRQAIRLRSSTRTSALSPRPRPSPPSARPPRFHPLVAGVGGKFPPLTGRWLQRKGHKRLPEWHARLESSAFRQKNKGKYRVPPYPANRRVAGRKRPVSNPWPW